MRAMPPPEYSRCGSHAYMWTERQLGSYKKRGYEGYAVRTTHASNNPDLASHDRCLDKVIVLGAGACAADLLPLTRTDYLRIL